MRTSGSEQRFLDALENHKKILYKIARLFSASAADRQDLIQEMMIQMWLNFDRFDQRSKFSTWLYRVCLNVAISWRRKQHRHVHEHIAFDENLLEMMVSDSPDENASHRALMIQSILQKLDEMDRALILLYLEGQEQDDIALIMDMSTSNVATRIGRIKLKLQREFAAV